MMKKYQYPQNVRHTWATTLLVLLLTTLTTMVGCAGSKQYDLGRKLADAGDYDQAIRHYRDAVQEDPDNAKYIDALADAEEKAAEKHVQRAEQLLSENRPAQAVRELEIALQQMPAHPRATVLITTARDQNQEAEALVNQAQQAADRQDWNSAYTLAEQARTLDVDRRQATEIYVQAKQALIEGYLGQAQRAFEAEQWEDCRRACKKVQSLQTDHAQAADLLLKVERREEAMQLYEKAQPAIAEGQYTTALTHLQQARALWPEKEEIASAAEQITDKARQAFISQAQKHAQSNDYAQALQVLKDGLALIPADQQLISYRRDLRNQWIAELRQKYDDAVQLDEPESAWACALKAGVLEGAQISWSANALTQSEEAIRQNIAYSVSVVPLKSETVGRQDSLNVVHMLTSALQAVKPSHVTLLERINLGEIVDEHDLSLADITEADKLNALGRKLEGADFLLFVELSSQERNERQQHHRAKSQYVAGKKWAENPDYAKAEEEFKQAKEAYDKARERALLGQMLRDATGKSRRRPSDSDFLRDAVAGYYGLKTQQAAEDYRAAENKLNNTPQRLLVDDWQEHEYPVYNVTREVTVRARLRLVEVATGRIWWGDNDAAAIASDTDTEIKADAAHNIEGKEAQPRAAQELHSEAIGKLEPVVARKAREMLAQQAAAFWRSAQKESGTDAVSDYVRFLFSCPTYPGEEAWNWSLTEIIGEQSSRLLLGEARQLAAMRLHFDQPALRDNATAAAVSEPAVAMATPSAAAEPVAEPNEVAPSATQPAAATADDSDMTDLIRAGLVEADQSPALPARTTPEPEFSPAPQESAEQQPEEEEQPAPPPPAEPTQPATSAVYRGVVSRDDDRFSKKLETIDGIFVEVKDTDDDPLDADLEITVGEREKEYRNLRPGAQITGQGISGRSYVLTVVRIIDDEETVHFTIEEK